MCASGKLSEAGAFFTKFYFVVLLFFGGVYGLSIVNSIFVDAMVSDNNEEVENRIANLVEQTQQLNQKLDQIIAHLENKNHDS